MLCVFYVIHIAILQYLFYLYCNIFSVFYVIYVTMYYLYFNTVSNALINLHIHPVKSLLFFNIANAFDTIIVDYLRTDVVVKINVISEYTRV